MFALPRPCCPESLVDAKQYAELAFFVWKLVRSKRGFLVMIYSAWQSKVGSDAKFAKSLQVKRETSSLHHKTWKTVNTSRYGIRQTKKQVVDTL